MALPTVTLKFFCDEASGFQAHTSFLNIKYFKIRLKFLFTTWILHSITSANLNPAVHTSPSAIHGGKRQNIDLRRLSEDLSFNHLRTINASKF